jgi:NAD+-dependent protein deacetylase sirtuin 6
MTFQSNLFPLKTRLHGNLYKEICHQCNRIYLRDFLTVERKRKINLYDKDRHKTVRKCLDCNVNLYDTTVAFKETLPEDEYEKAEKHSKKADLVLVFGTSMRVSPACNLPLMNLENGYAKMIISNLQMTPCKFT